MCQVVPCTIPMPVVALSFQFKATEVELDACEVRPLAAFGAVGCDDVSVLP